MPCCRVAPDRAIVWYVGNTAFPEKLSGGLDNLSAGNQSFSEQRHEYVSGLLWVLGADLDFQESGSAIWLYMILSRSPSITTA